MWHWKRRAQELEGERRRLAKSLPKRMAATIGRLHIPLLRELCEAAGHEDLSLIDDLLHGFPITGPLDAGGVGVPVEGGKRTHGRPAHGAAPDVEMLRSRCQEINTRTLASAVPDACAKDVWQKTKAEETAGMVGALRQIHELDLSKVLLVRRFGVETWSSQQGRKAT